MLKDLPLQPSKSLLRLDFSCNDFVYSPWSEAVNNNVGQSTAVTSAPAYIDAKITLPLHCGVFAENKKVFPNILTNGVYIELVMADNRNLFRQVDGVMMTRRLKLNPRFMGVDKDGATWDNGATTDTFFFYNDNNQRFPQNCPFIIGEKVGFSKDGTLANVSGYSTITEIVEEDGFLKITTAGDETNNTGDDLGDDGGETDYHAVSLSLWASDGAFNPSCKVSNVEMICHQIDMGEQYENAMLKKVREGGVVRFDIPSVAVQRYSTLSSEVQATIPLHLEYARAKGIIAMPTDATLYSCAKQSSSYLTYIINKDADEFIEDTLLKSNRTGIEGCSNGLSEYSWFLNGKMVPSRPINTRKTTNKKGSIDAHYISELEKALVSFGIPPRSLEYYNRNFLIGRMLTLGENAVFDGRGRTARLDCKYEGTTEDVDEPSVNLLWKIFISHLRTLTIKGDSIAVEV